MHVPHFIVLHFLHLYGCRCDDAINLRINIGTQRMLTINMLLGDHALNIGHHSLKNVFQHFEGLERLRHWSRRRRVLRIGRISTTRRPIRRVIRLMAVWWCPSWVLPWWPGRLLRVM